VTPRRRPQAWGQQLQMNQGSSWKLAILRKPRVMDGFRLRRPRPPGRADQDRPPRGSGDRSRRVHLGDGQRREAMHPDGSSQLRKATRQEQDNPGLGAFGEARRPEGRTFSLGALMARGRETASAVELFARPPSSGSEVAQRSVGDGSRITNRIRRVRLRQRLFSGRWCRGGGSREMKSLRTCG
jgi:hypothetical protein